MTKADNITLSMARCIERQQERLASLQGMALTITWECKHYDIIRYKCLIDNLELRPIVSIMTAPRELLMPDNKPYIYIAFDYEPKRDERLIVKLSEKYYTTHFRELISLN